MLETQCLALLKSIGVLPKLLSAGLQYLGVKEFPGLKSNNPIIMNMAKQLGIAKIYQNDEMAWCALFMSFLCLITGKPMPFAGYEIVRAASFVKWGNEIGAGQACLGDVVVINRAGGYHVAILIGVTDKNTYIIFGANQSNKVGFMEIEIDRVIAYRRFYKTEAPDSASKLYRLDSSGNFHESAA